MKIIITGASGHVGQKLIPALTAKGHSLMLLGRDRETLRSLFPTHACDSYDHVDAAALSGFEICLHLATRNNDQPGSAEDFHRDNVVALQALVERQISAGIVRHIFVSSILASDASSSHYAKSKCQAERMLCAIADREPSFRLTILRPALIHTGCYRGRMALFNSLPGPVGRLVFDAVSAVRPVLTFSRFEKTILALVEVKDTPGQLSSPQQRLILTNRQIGNPVYGAGRWLLDVLFVLAVIVVFGWLFPLLMLLIRLESPGPSFFIQPRVGKDGRTFLCCKFRTMKQGTKNVATHEIGQASVTRMGRFLRKSKIDELPQIWNIMRREMSLVGPRPCLTTQQTLINCRKDLDVLDVLPGITGLAQINNIDMSDPERLARVDADYILKRTLLLDAMIVLRTFLGGGMQDKVSK